MLFIDGEFEFELSVKKFDKGVLSFIVKYARGKNEDFCNQIRILFFNLRALIFMTIKISVEKLIFESMIEDFVSKLLFFAFLNLNISSNY